MAEPITYRASLLSIGQRGFKLAQDAGMNGLLRIVTDGLKNGWQYEVD